jgi:hypothetical protein
MRTFGSRRCVSLRSEVRTRSRSAAAPRPSASAQPALVPLGHQAVGVRIPRVDEDDTER